MDEYEIRLLQFVSEQHAVKIDQLTRAFGVYRADMERILAELEEDGFLRSKQFLTGDDVWVWLTWSGVRAAGTGFVPREPHYRSLAHWAAITDARIFVESRVENAVWVCERMLRRQQGGKPKGYLPDAVVIQHVTTAEGTKGIRHFAIEAELSSKSEDQLEDKISSNEKKYDQVVYFANASVCRKFEKLGLLDKHPKLQLFEIPSIERALNQDIWRVPGDPPLLVPGERIDYDAIELTELELDVVDFVLEHGEAPTDQLEAFFELEPEEAEYLLSRLVHLRVFERSKPLVAEPPWVWATRAGARFSRTGLRARPPHLNGLEQVRAAIEVRLRLAKEIPDLRWTSNRHLNQIEGKSWRAVPTGAIEVGAARHAVDILLFVKNFQAMHDLLAKRLEGGYGGLVWFYSKKSSSVVRKFERNLPEKYRKRLKILPLPDGKHLLMVPGPPRTRRANGKRALPPSSPHTWIRLAAKPPGRLRRLALESVRPEALEAIARATGIDRPPVVREAWIQLGSNGVRWLVTDVGFFRVAHSSWGTRADEVVSEDHYVKEEGPEVTIYWRPKKPSARGISGPRMYEPERHEIDDRIWELVAPMLPSARGAGPLGLKARKPVPNRNILSGAIWRLRNGGGWQVFPRELGYGSGAVIRSRLRRWQESGVWGRVVEVLKAELPDGESLEWWRLEPDEVKEERGLPLRGEHLKPGAPRVKKKRKSPKPKEPNPERHETDVSVWESVEQILAAIPEHPDKLVRSPAYDRAVLSGIVWHLRDGGGWARIPTTLGYGHAEAIKRRLREWEEFDVWDDIRDVLEAQLPDGKTFDWETLRPSEESKREPFESRQRSFLERMLANPKMEITYEDYQRLVGVSSMTARKDLTDLAEQWLVIGAKTAAEPYTFTVPRDLPARLALLERD